MLSIGVEAKGCKLGRACTEEKEDKFITYEKLDAARQLSKLPASIILKILKDNPNFITSHLRKYPRINEIINFGVILNEINGEFYTAGGRPPILLIAEQMRSRPHDFIPRDLVTNFIF